MVFVVFVRRSWFHHTTQEIREEKIWKICMKRKLDQTTMSSTNNKDEELMRIGYWSIRGLGAPCRMMTMYAGVKAKFDVYDVKPKVMLYDSLSEEKRKASFIPSTSSSEKPRCPT